MTRFVYVLPAGRFRWEVRVDVNAFNAFIADVAEAMGPSRNCECTLDSDTCDECWLTATAAVDAAFPLTKERLFYRRKADALIAARAIAIIIGGEVQPHNRWGRIQDPDSHGNDPRETKG